MRSCPWNVTDKDSICNLRKHDQSHQYKTLIIISINKVIINMVEMSICCTTLPTSEGFVMGEYLVTFTKENHGNMVE